MIYLKYLPNEYYRPFQVVKYWHIFAHTDIMDTNIDTIVLMVPYTRKLKIQANGKYEAILYLTKGSLANYLVKIG